MDLTAADQLALLRRFEPILRFTAGELFLPASVDDYVRRCELMTRGPNGRRELLVQKGQLDIERLVECGEGHPRPGQFLRFVDAPFGRAQVARWRASGDRPRFHNASRLARVGVLSRGIDALSRASLMVRGRVVNGTEAAAEVQYRTQMRPDHHPYYGRVVQSCGYTVLQYWYFYVFNDWRSRVYGVNDHEADWEQVTIYLVPADGDGDGDGDGDAGDVAEWQPRWIAASAHDDVGDDLRRRWDDPDLTLLGEHPVIHPGLGSHSGALLAGEYLTAVEGAAFARLLRWTRKVSRSLLPWTRGQVDTGLSIPYIDYSRGDGVSIGAGQQRAWEPVVIDETTPWLLHYRGLWGNDTHDPLGGERGPAGPRYERSTAVRTSWGDPVGWANLRKVPPDAASAAAALRQRLAELDDEIVALGAQIDEQALRQRALVSTGETVAPSNELALAALAAQRVARRDERLLLARGLDHPPPPAGPHDHLRHRRLPLPAETRARRRLLAVWSAISTSVVLAIAAAMLVDRGWTVASLGVEAVVLLFAVEAIARRQFVRFALLMAAAVVGASIALTIAGRIIDDWRVLLAVPLALVAVALMVINLKELLRD